MATKIAKRSSDIQCYDVNKNHLVTFDNISISDGRVWNAFNRTWDFYYKQQLPTPVKKLSKAMMKILHQHGMPTNTVFIQR